MKLKVCGMRYTKNIAEVTAISPDYMGFIFWEPSSRFFKGTIPKLPVSIKKVGVFVDAPIQKVIELVEVHQLQAVQLHGKEDPAYCKNLRNSFAQKQVEHDNIIEIIKAFSIDNDFDFDGLKPYEEVCDYYLFDSKGKLPGGNGYTFNWEVLKGYTASKPYFLSGGIGPDELDHVLQFLETPASKYCKVIDVNSRFEIEPGLKNSAPLKAFKKSLSKNNKN